MYFIMEDFKLTVDIMVKCVDKVRKKMPGAASFRALHHVFF